MEPKGATDIAIRNRNYNIKPAQVVDAHASDDDSDFPEFEFPTTNGASTIDTWKAVSTTSAGSSAQLSQGTNGINNSAWGFLQPGGVFSDESPKKMPLAFRTTSSEDPFFSDAPPTRPYISLSPLATFKNLDVSLDNGVDPIEEKPKPKSTAPSTPTRKSGTNNLSQLQADLARAKAKTLPASRLTTVTTPKGRDQTRPVSPTPDRRSGFQSPRRPVPERSRSPAPFQTPERAAAQTRSVSPSPRSLTPTRAAARATPTTPRSTSPMPARPAAPKEQWNANTTRASVSMPNSPRYITPTRAASLKAVTPNGTVAKELQYSTPRSDPVKKVSPKASSEEVGHPTLKVRMSPPLTQPAEFNFKTDERSEKRRDFYSKLEERMKAKEEERRKLEAKAQEEKEAQLKELRKSLGYKANPVPKFYQEPPPPPVEIKRSPPTRARSPNFTAPRRRDSCMGRIQNGSFSESTTSSSGSSPLRCRLVRSPSLESNSGSHSSHSHRVAPKVKQPFKPV